MIRVMKMVEMGQGGRVEGWGRWVRVAWAEGLGWGWGLGLGWAGFAWGVLGLGWAEGPK